MMSVLLCISMIFVTVIENGCGKPTSTVKSEKPLFIPSAGNPTLIHATIQGVGRLESAAHYTPFGQNSAFYDSSESLQRQPLYAPIERVLQILHHRSENKKLSENINFADEDDYKHKANNLLSSEPITPELEDLDRRYKRATTYVPWDMPIFKTTAPNLDANRPAPTLNSRAVNVAPFGPYTTWLPYQGPRFTSYAGPKKTLPARRRRHDDEGNYEDGENPYENQFPLQYAPAFNNYASPYASFPANLEPYHTRFVRDMPIQYSFVYEPPYPIRHETSDNFALLTNSLLQNGSPDNQADELERLPLTY